MSKQKNILILTESRGGKGHIMPATAITQALHRIFPHKHNVTLVNMGDESNFVLEDFLHFLYVQISKHAPWVLGLYKLSDHKIFMKTVNNIYYEINKKDIIKLYDRINPDLVLSNYPAWDYAFYKTLKANYPSVPYVNLNTDSSYPHYGWLLADADYNIVADEDTKHLYQGRGKDVTKIKVLGIPIREDVAKLGKTTKIAKLKPKPPYKILFLPTSSNSRNIMKFIKPFADNPEFELEVILGRNKTAIEYLGSKLSANNIKLTGWTDDIAQKLAVSHIVISKAGGSTTQECIAMKKPMVINKIIPGQEEGNVKLIEKHRVGIVATKPEDAKKACLKIIKDYPAYQKRLNELSHKDSAEEIARLIDSVEA